MLEQQKPAGKPDLAIYSKTLAIPGSKHRRWQQQKGFNEEDVDAASNASLNNLA